MWYLARQDVRRVGLSDVPIALDGQRRRSSRWRIVETSDPSLTGFCPLRPAVDQFPRGVDGGPCPPSSTLSGANVPRSEALTSHSKALRSFSPSDPAVSTSPQWGPGASSEAYRSRMAAYAERTAAPAARVRGRSRRGLRPTGDRRCRRESITQTPFPTSRTMSSWIARCRGSRSGERLSL